MWRESEKNIESESLQRNDNTEYVRCGAPEVIRRCHADRSAAYPYMI